MRKRKINKRIEIMRICDHFHCHAMPHRNVHHKGKKIHERERKKKTKQN